MILPLDIAVLQFLYALRDPSTVQIFIWITELGSTTAIVGLTLAAAIVLAYRKRFAEPIGLFIAVGGTFAVVFLLKDLLARARPELFYQAYEETGFSFPSGHAALSLALYGFCIYLLWRLMPTHKWTGIGIAVLNALILTIGFSRIYLGVHYLSDVIAGYAVGLFFLWIATRIIKQLNRR